jgi:hypothetical protein
MVQEVRTRTIFEDAGHSWLMVSKAELVDLGIHGEISPFSYQKDGFAFLEEDCDLGAYKEALRSRGIELSFERVYHVESPVRSFHDYCA